MGALFSASSFGGLKELPSLEDSMARIAQRNRPAPGDSLVYSYAFSRVTGSRTILFDLHCLKLKLFILTNVSSWRLRDHRWLICMSTQSNRIFLSTEPSGRLFWPLLFQYLVTCFA